MAQILLHGTLHVTIFEVDRLAGGTGRKIFHQFEAAVGLGKGSSLYATIDLERARVGRTRLLDHEYSNPRWYETFHIYCAHLASNVVFSVKEDDAIGAPVLGRAYLPVKDLLGGDVVDQWLDLLDKDHKPIHKGSKIHVKVQFLDVTREVNWDRGIMTGAKFPGVPFTFFSQRKGCKVTLYQDVHVPDNFVPKIPLDDGQLYQPHRCWEDIFDALNNAKHLIYLTGWSVYTEITLIRDPRRSRPGGDMTLGEILKKKASEGVRVLMLVWDDRTSVPVFKKDGLMATHDTETEEYFRDSEVHCVLCPRNPDSGMSIVQDLEIGTMFTHHQKSVIVDSALPSGGEDKRRILSFIGGIDLCDGRYDTQFHSLFRTLDTVNHNDFHQPNFKDSSIQKGGPREPWHDIHSRLEGPVAWDVLFNFEQRWRKQGIHDLLLNLRDLAIIPPSSVTFPDDPSTWNVQVFRSIDGGAAFGFPDSPEEAAKSGLVSGKDNIIDRSIQDGYINAIRRAKNFIYIENQYFLGSSFAWAQTGDIIIEDIGCLHLIPKEVSLKIVSKIEKGERFMVYVVVPMWPEGVPESGSVQAILDWQRRTMEMMYTDIAQALSAKGIQGVDLRDYLSFFCLGNREVKKSGEYLPSEKPEPDTDYDRAQTARRFMIYVHAKMMIVDDEYIIIGSANINQRSMDGARDSEIAMGAYQPYHIATREKLFPRGQIHGFRLSLWYEHLGMLDETFLKPNSVECSRKVNQVAQKYWDLYSSETLEKDLPGHLLTYPIGITASGEITEVPGFENFPDTKAKVLGTRSEYLPPILTT